METISDLRIRASRIPLLFVALTGLILLGVAASSCRSRQDRAFGKILPGMAESEVRALVGDPLEVHRPPLPPDSPSCARDAAKALVYRRSEKARMWIYLDPDGRVLCDSLEMSWIQR